MEKTRLLAMAAVSTRTADAGEPDNTQPMIRLLHHANHFEIEGK